MLEIYLPIVQVNVDIFLLLFLSLLVGVLSGLFGVGGGFLMTPFLIFMGIPPVYAVPNEVNNILATSVSGSLTHWFKNTLDYKMGFMIMCGGIVGTTIGMMTFSYFSDIGKISTIISLLYMNLLAIVGTLMLVDTLRESRKKKMTYFVGNFTSSVFGLFFLISLIIFLAQAAIAPRNTARRIAKAPYKKGASLLNFKLNSAKKFKSVFKTWDPLKSILSLKKES